MLRLASLPPIEPTPRPPSHSACKRFWIVPISHHPRIILWRFYHSKLPSRARLHRFSPKTFASPACVLCDQKGHRRTLPLVLSHQTPRLGYYCPPFSSTPYGVNIRSHSPTPALPASGHPPPPGRSPSSDCLYSARYLVSTLAFRLPQ
ncbi:hypothetical protein BX666DRAFT_326777 [Dichotomocladium elegans]|nr:hypothetical protein BX666DRAFT_326777 [Dichotomocladium elegans]